MQGFKTDSPGAMSSKGIKHTDYPFPIRDRNTKCNECESLVSMSQSLSLNLSPTNKVYLKLKSNTPKTLLSQEDETYVVQNSTTLLTKCTSFDSKIKGAKVKNEFSNKKFTFTRIFDSKITQADFFDQCARRQIIDFLLGKSSVFMTYGTSNSGKTHTLYGTSTSPGIIPRSIEFIFSAINCTLAPWYKSTHGSIVTLDEHDRTREIQNKMSIINPKIINKDQCLEARRSLENSTSHLESEDRENCGGESMCSVWLSCAEIYNENVYDLLSMDEQDRRPLKLVTDKDGVTYMKDLRTVHVTTALEACQILVSAQSKMTVGQTAMNPRSSRSHTIFTVKLLKYQKEDVPDEVQCSTLTFCDLAGSGGSKTIKDVGVRLTESRYINNSLLVLGRCLKTVCYSHSLKQIDSLIGPFRESKLTRIFQKALTGREQVTFIVNVDPASDLLAETQSVLNFSSIAKKIIIETKDPRRTFASELTFHSPILSSTWDFVTLPSIEQSPEKSTIDVEELEALKEENEKLTVELETLKTTLVNYEKSMSKNLLRSQSTNTLPCFVGEKDDFVTMEEYEHLREENEKLAEKLETLDADRLNREFEIRQELVNQYSKIIEDLEDTWRKRTQEIEDEGRDLLKWSVNQVELFYKERIDSIVHNKKRKRTDSGDYNEENRSICQELEAENSQITSKVVVLRELVRKLNTEIEEISTDKNKFSFELALVKEKLKDFQQLIRTRSTELSDDSEDDMTNSIRLLDKLKCTINETIRNNQDLEKDLQEVRSDYVRITSSAVKTEQELCEAKITLQKCASRIKELEDEVSKKTNYIHTLEFPSPTHTNQNICASILNKTIRKYSSIGSNDFFCNDEIVDTASITQAHVDIKIDGYNFHNKNSKKISFNSSDGYCRSSFESGADHSSTFRSSDGSLKEDSGIGSSSRSQRSTSLSDSIKIHETEEKCTQTCIPHEEEKGTMQEKVETSEIDFTKLKVQHLPESSRDAELSPKLENIKEVTRRLKEIAENSKLEIDDYRNKLTARENDVERLTEENNEMILRYNELLNTLQTKSQEYEKRIAELSDRLIIKKKNENRTCKCLNDYLEKSANLESQISILHKQLEKSSIKCNTDHVPKIERLEKELLTKTLQLNEMAGKIAEMQGDLFKLHDLHDKVNEFQTILENCQKDKNDYRRRLEERLETQLSLEMKSNRLSTRIHERDTELMSLKTEIGNAMHVHVANSEKVKDLSKQITEANTVIEIMKEELARSEELRKGIQKTSNQEIYGLQVWLTAFERNTAILKQIRESMEDKQDEIDRLKLQLCEKDQEMNLFKKHRDTTIEKYETLVRQLQGEIEKRREQLVKLENIFLPLSKESTKFDPGRSSDFKVAKSLNKFPQIVGYTWKSSQQNKEVDDEESDSLNPSCSVLQESDSNVFETSSTDCERSFKNTSPVDEDRESYRTESSSPMNESDRGTQSDVSDNTGTPCSCGIGFASVKGQGRMSGWMSIRRIDAKTELLPCSNRDDTNFDLTESET